jgi:DNA-binding SARP family transcriptional activator/DNA-binding beta-propeller fold protein YncE
MRFLVLGSLEARGDGRELELGPGRQRALLALLVLHAGEVLSLDRLVDALWREQPPASAAKVVQGYVSQLRRVLGAEAIVTRGSGYRLAGCETDADEFERLLAQARAQEPAEAASTLRQALALWRGHAFADVEYEPWAQAEIGRLEELRLVALEERIEAELQLGEAARLVPEVEALVAEYPLRERLAALLMLALYRSGRQADALEAYAAARRRLVGELGIEPGPELQELQRRILTQDPGLGGPARVRPLARAASRARWLVAAGALTLAAAATAGGLLLAGASERVRANSVVLLDARSGKVDAQIGVGSLPSQIAVGAGAVWVLNSGDDTVTEIDPGSRRPVATFATATQVVGIAAAGGALWLASSSGSRGYVLPVSLTKVDPGTRATLLTVPLPVKYLKAVYTRFPGERIVVAGGGSVWVVDGEYRLVRIDARTGDVQRRFTFGADALAFGGGELWLVQQGSRVLRLDPKTNRVDLTFPLAAGTSLDYGFGSAWVADPVQSLVWRISPGIPARARSIAVATGSTAVTAAAHAVWASSALTNEVTRIDPETNRADTEIALTAPQDLAPAAQGVWVSTGASPPSSGPLPASSCGPLVYGGTGRPRFIVASDLALTDASARWMQHGIEQIIRERGFRAGKYTVGYQSCDDSTHQSGAFDWAKCITNARDYSADLDVIGVVGTDDSGCASVEIPILDVARQGPVAMVSPLNTDGGLTIPSAGAPPGLPIDPTGARNYARVIAGDQIQYAADAVLERDLGVKRIAVLDDGSSTDVDAEHWFSYAARHLGLKTVSVAWKLDHPAADQVLARVRATHADGVFVAGGDYPGGARLVAALHAGLGPKVPIVVTDWLAGWRDLLRVGGRSVDGVYASTAGVPDSSLPPAGRGFVRRVGSRSFRTAVNGGAAAEVLLDAIARSDGTRASVARDLFATHIRSLLGDLRIDARGDPTTAAVTIFRIEAGAHNDTGQGDLQDAVVDRVIEPPPRVIPYSQVRSAG